MKKKGLALLLCSAMLMTCFSGCGFSDNGSSTASQVSEEQMEGTPEEDNSTQSATSLYENGIQDYQYAAGEMKKYEEGLTLTFGRNIDLDAEHWLEMAERG